MARVRSLLGRLPTLQVAPTLFVRQSHQAPTKVVTNAHEFVQARFVQGINCELAKSLLPVDTFACAVHERANVLLTTLLNLSTDARKSYVKFLGDDLILDVLSHTEFQSQKLMEEVNRLLLGSGSKVEILGSGVADFRKTLSPSR